LAKQPRTFPPLITLISSLNLFLLPQTPFFPPSLKLLFGNIFGDVLLLLCPCSLPAASQPNFSFLPVKNPLVIHHSFSPHECDEFIFFSQLGCIILFFSAIMVNSNPSCSSPAASTILHRFQSFAYSKMAPFHLTNTCFFFYRPPPLPRYFANPSFFSRYLPRNRSSSLLLAGLLFFIFQMSGDCPLSPCPPFNYHLLKK